MQLRVVTYLIALATVFFQSAGELIIVPCDTESKVGETIYFHCSTNLDSGEIFWYHGIKYIYTGSMIFEPYSKRFEIERNASIGAQNLVIHSVEPGDAGIYSCADDDGSGRRHSAQLIVLDDDPECQSNIQSDGVIGQNIFNLTPDEVQLSCNVIYHGNFPPKMEWKKVGENSSIQDNVMSIVASNNRYNYTLKLKGDISLDKSSYICQTTRSRHYQYNCTSEITKVLYFIGGNTKQVNIAKGEILACNVGNYTLQCTKHWYHDNNTSPLSSSETFKPHLPGHYLCQVKCHIRGKEYDFNAMKAFVYEETTAWGSTSITLVVLSVALLVILLSLLLGFIVYKRRNERRAQSEERRENESFVVKEKKGRKHPTKQDQSLIVDYVYLDHPILIKTIKTTKAVKEKDVLFKGVTVFKKEVFVLTVNSSEIEVYDVENLEFMRRFTIAGLINPLDIKPCLKNNCLYIFDCVYVGEPGKILKIDHEGKILKAWQMEDSAARLSVASNGNFIVSLGSNNKILEYNSDGDKVREIELDGPRHAILLENRQFLISQGYSDEDESHRVFKLSLEEGGTGLKIANDDERIVEAYGGDKGSNGKMNVPWYMAVDKNGYILVAERENQRVTLLSPTLKFERILISDEYGLRRPRNMHMDIPSGRLFVTDFEWDKHKKVAGRLLVFQIRERDNIQE